MIILISIGLGISLIIVSQIKMIKGMGYSVVALYAADTGIERVLYEDKWCRQAGCSSLSWPCVDSTDCDDGRLGGSISGSLDTEIDYQVDFNDGATTIISRGAYKATKRAIEATR